jgi:hypothetical protein
MLFCAFVRSQLKKVKCRTECALENTPLIALLNLLLLLQSFSANWTKTKEPCTGTRAVDQAAHHALVNAGEREIV